MAKDNEQWQAFRNGLAFQMGVDDQRKAEVYLEIAKAATLKDTTYWLQVIFAAGIATIGLVLNSPAVIIGGMLISPLMGPILALGLSLATGDFILLARAIANLALSCLTAISFAVFLIFSLPFKEFTSEILTRTQPNILDLGVALFSGAVGAIATCRPVKGVVTSIPGVAIAVALMPPLCVVGFGIGSAFSLNLSDGLQIARGGGLLFITNLVAIAFSSLLVFLLLHIDTNIVREKVKDWTSHDLESLAVQDFLGRYDFLKRLRPIGSLVGRLLAGVLAVLALLVPLSSAFSKLSEEIVQKQYQNSLRRTATNIWQSQYSNYPDSQLRSSIERITIIEKDRLLIVNLNVFTSKLYSESEKEQYVQELAKSLNKEPRQIQFILTEIPTASNEILAKKEEIPLPIEVKPPSLNELQTNLFQGLNDKLNDLTLPPNFKLIDYTLAASRFQSLSVSITYLSDRPMSDDANALIIQDVQTRIGIADAKVTLEHINGEMGEITFEENKPALPLTANTKLDQLGNLLKRYPNLNLLISVSLRSSENNALRKPRFQAIASYLESKWQINQNRLTIDQLSNTSILNPVDLQKNGGVFLQLTD
jgi:uncharacterized hydrophobic protein (TIGR00271 family)